MNTALDLARNYTALEKYKDIRSELWSLGYEEIGMGSSRTVFRISNKKVIKLARFNVGIMQNNNEYDWYKFADTKDSLVKSYECINNGLVLISEYVKEFTYDKFAEIYQIHFVDFSCHVGGSKAYINRLNVSDKTKQLLRNTTEFMHKFNIPRTEICRGSAWGFTGNNAKLLDYGADYSMLQDYYSGNIPIKSK